MFDFASYHRAATLADAINLLADNPQAKLLAGGTDVLIQLHHHNDRYRHIVDIHNLAELRGITLAEDGSLRIGSATTFTQLIEDPITQRHLPALCAAATSIAGPQIRNVAIPDIDQANCMIKLESDGTFIVHSGGADIGTGLDTVVTKLAAEVLHCPPQDVHVISGDTDHALFDKGAYASSGTCFSGNAARLAAENLREKILFHGAQMLGEPVADVQLATPGVVRGKKGEVSFGDIAHKGETGTGFGSLVGTGSYITPDFAFPYGANFAEVAVNTRTGEIRLDKFYALLDCGTPVNPELALGQIYGATLRAIGHSMSEEIIYDAEGHPLTRDLRSYGAPKIGDIPRDFRAVLVPSDDKVGPFGAKSISEIGVNGAAPAIATAIHDACGIWLREWHFTPEKILTALEKI